MSEKFEESIKQYYQSEHSNLEYLDLAIKKPEKICKGSVEFYCFKKGFLHSYHTEDKQLNLIADCQYQGLQNIAYIRNQIALLSKVTLKNFKECKSREENLEKDLATIRKTQLSQPSTSKVAEFISSTFDQPKKVESEARRLVEKLDKRIDRLEELVEKLISHLI